MTVDPAQLDAQDLAALSARLESLDARGRLAWAAETWGEALVMTSAFGPGAGALLHLWHEVCPGRPVHFLDTGFLFAETLAYRDTLTAQLGLDLVVMRPKLPRGAFLAKYGLTVYQDDPDTCCQHNKVEPLQEGLLGARAWVSGLRRSQGAARAETPVLVLTEGPAKVHPLADWTARDIYQYLGAHNLPEHPLFAEGYTSVGCTPCTRPPLDPDDERSGRWAGSTKTECGIHTFLKPRTA